jgi:hypothetical protein
MKNEKGAGLGALISSNFILEQGPRLIQPRDPRLGYAT